MRCPVFVVAVCAAGACMDPPVPGSGESDDPLDGPVREPFDFLAIGPSETLANYRSIVLVDLESGAQESIECGTLSPIRETAAWSPNGARVACVGMVGNYDGTSLFSVGVERSDELARLPSEIFSTGDTVAEIAWSPTGGAVAVVLESDIRGEHLVLVDVEARALVQLAAGVFSRPSWSPDGERFVVAQADGAGTTEVGEPTYQPPKLAFYSLDGEATSVRPHGPNASVTGYGDPVWSPAGSSIAYVRLFPEATQVWLWNVESAEHTAVTTVPCEHDAPVWLPDGSRLVVHETCPDGDTHVVVATSTGAVERTIVGLLGPVEVSPDATMLLSSSADSAGVHVYDLRDDSVRKVADGERAMWRPRAP